CFPLIPPPLSPLFPYTTLFRREHHQRPALRGPARFRRHLRTGRPIPRGTRHRCRPERLHRHLHHHATPHRRCRTTHPPLRQLDRAGCRGRIVAREWRGRARGTLASRRGGCVRHRGWHRRVAVRRRG